MRKIWVAASLFLLLTAGCAEMRPPLPPPPVHPNGGVLWTIISQQCVPHQREKQDPAPCAVVSIDQGQARGFVVLKDRDGVAQQLLMPTEKITGIEDPKLLAPDLPNYFQAAWDARRFVAARLGGALPRDEVSIAVNSVYGRTQDQLHLHVDCLDMKTRDALRAVTPTIGRRWSRRFISVAGHPYRIMRLDGDDLTGKDPFRLLITGIHGSAREMGAWTLVLVGATLPDGRPGYYLLAGHADPAAGEKGSGEVMQDHACKGVDVAKP